ADTPLMRQFLDVKERYPDAIVFFRLGDFYEMFFEDATVAAGLLDLTLTTRDKGKPDAVPMCGVPHHAARGYVARLTELGHRVVIAEQVEDPKLARGLVKREVVRVVTPGVVVDEEALDPKAARFVAAVVPGPAEAEAPSGRSARADASARAVEDASAPRWGLAYLDVTTGEFRATELATVAALADELARVGPREVIASKELLGGEAIAPLRRVRTVWTAADVPALAEAGALLDGALAERIDSQAAPRAVRAAAAVLAYARATQPAGALPVSRLAFYDPAATVVLDETAIANLELTETLIGARRDGSLLALLDETATSPGARLLRRWLLYPLTEVAAIRRRHDAVEWLVARPEVGRALRELLRTIGDLERLAGKCTLGVAQPRDLGRIRDGLATMPELVMTMVAAAGEGGLEPVPALLDVAPAATRALAALVERLAATLVDEPPALLKDGGVIRAGVDATVDECRRLADGGKDAILAIEARERERSGIGSLKVRYNRVFGYYIEISRSQLTKVPSDYQRKQTVATGERYVTPELAELEAKVLGAEETLAVREAELFKGLVGEVAAVAPAVIAAGAAIATVDVLLALATVANRRGFCRPIVDDGAVLDIADGRHPVVEAVVPAGTFVPNDARLDCDREQILLVTGPNMAGKSTYLRQVAQIVLLAQMGSFVPAARATIGVCDRVFTRVGAADNLARGDSTFMVEMRETAAILGQATRRSLVILDEVGRGTSTFDGVSIAWAVVEYLHDAIGARTLFATHYHELTALAESRARLRNVAAQVREHKGEVVFLRRIAPGGASRSYGIDVARLAGLPRSVIARARQILGRLETGNSLGGSAQLSLLPLAAPPAEASSPVVARLRELDVDHLRPIDALNALAELKALLT
ncbi:MAG TPA: DNA mismatch repair protein MutS, partial [Kofleriaceae bacterium]|nr:DNA mismatch repair protein MutS [Kofleriaceae bacterium]